MGDGSTFLRSYNKENLDAFFTYQNVHKCKENSFVPALKEAKPLQNKKAQIFTL